MDLACREITLAAEFFRWQCDSAGSCQSRTDSYKSVIPREAGASSPAAGYIGRSAGEADFARGAVVRRDSELDFAGPGQSTRGGNGK